MTIDMSQFFQVFFEETEEHLANMESLLLTLDTEQPNLDDLNAIFRAAHSIKGGSGTFGFTDMTEVTHILETLLDRLRKCELEPTAEMVDAFLRSVDVLKGQLHNHRGGSEPVDPAEIAGVCADLSRLSDGGSSPAPTAGVTPNAVAPQTDDKLKVFRITVDPNSSDKGDLLLEDLASIGRIFERESVSGSLIFKLETGLSEAELRDIFAFFLQPADFTMAGAGEVAKPATEEAYGFFDDTPAVSEAYGFFDAAAPAVPLPVVDEGFGFFDDAPGTPGLASAPTDAESAPKPYGFFVPEAELEAERDKARGYGFFKDPTPPTASQTAAAPIASATQTKAVSPKAEGKPAANPAASGDSSIRVSVEKVDQLINLVGELVITQAMLAQTASEVDPVLQEKLLSGVALLQRNTRDLQEAVMSIRMLPMNFVFSRFPRLVRDLAAKLGKEVNFKTEGEGTELDKGLIEKITDPLTHLVRNSLDHGIELPEVRTSKGKSPKGNLVLRAFHQGGNVIIEVQDDGGGLNRDRILAKARERGLAVNDAMPDSEVWQLIFAPGFSTAEQVTDVSGRGVGMDVVKKNIESLGGRVEIDSVQHAGTKITIRLPLTLAILDGLSIAVGNEVFIVPLTSIVESLQPAPEDVKTVAGQGRVVHVRGEYLPLVTLYDVFGIEPQHYEPHKGTLMIVEGDGIKGAMLVDELMGQHQVVIKSLESNYRKVLGVSGATIMGDGRVALILDVTAVMKLGRTLAVRSTPLARTPVPDRSPQSARGAVSTSAAAPEAAKSAKDESAIDDVAHATIQLENAVGAHSKWKTRLRLFLDGGDEKLDPQTVCKDSACDLGKWIYGDGVRYRDVGAYKELKGSHAQFHQCAADVVTRHMQGDKKAAEAMLDAGGAFSKASQNTVQAIIKLQKTLETRAR